MSIPRIVLGLTAILMGPPLAAAESVVKGTATYRERIALPADAVPLGELPATFYGELPCASCPGIQTTVTLRPDGIFLSRSIYLEAEDGEDGNATDLGRWSTSDDGKALTLRGNAGTRRLSIESPSALRLLDPAGRPIESNLDYGLRRVDHDPIEDRLHLRGMYVYMADAARFAECLTGMDRAVAFEQDSISLERAYLDARGEPGQRIQVTFEGHLTHRPAMEGDKLEEVFVVETFDQVRPDESCEPTKPDVTLTNTHWRLTELDGRPSTVAEGQRGPYFRLILDDSRITGSGGCNQISGVFELEGSQLRFDRVASTAMACEGGMEQERDFFTALGETTGYLVTGERLDLYGDDNVPRLRLEAIYFD